MIVFIICCSTTTIYGQLTQSKTQFGIQYRPIIPNRFIGQNIEDFEYLPAPSFSGTFKQLLGYSAGIAIRHSFNSYFSFETGINFVKRNYLFNYVAIDSGLSAESDVSFIGYDIPMNGLVYVQLSKLWFMNASAGLNIGFYPSSVESQNIDATTSEIFKQITKPRRKTQIGLNINYGFEMRTEKTGTFYFGLSYMLPFKYIAVNQLTWVHNGTDYWTNEEVNGSFLTFDLKYFFPN
ncbi:MAG: outer membrane beta-barrel protein [Crocinitomicaceae bacterium]